MTWGYPQQWHLPPTCDSEEGPKSPHSAVQCGRCCMLVGFLEGEIEEQEMIGHCFRLYSAAVELRRELVWKTLIF